MPPHQATLNFARKGDSSFPISGRSVSAFGPPCNHSHFFSSIHLDSKKMYPFMILNYIKISLRSILKHKLFSITNILGLAIGVLCCILIMNYVLYETSYDKWNPNLDRIVRPYSDINFGGTKMEMAVTSAIVAPDAAAALPEIESWCRIRDYSSSLLRKAGTDEVNLLETDILSADSTFFTLFPTQSIEGNLQHCLVEPQTAAISESLAEKLFGRTTGIVDQILLLDNREEWTIKAVYKDLPSNTHFDAQMLQSLTQNQEVAESPPFWAASNNFHTYFLLRNSVKSEDFNAKFDALSREKMSITARTLLGMSIEDFEATGQYARYGLQTLEDIHLHSQLQVELSANGDIRYVWIFSTIAILVLLIACINFMNLTTAKSSQRLKEIAMRKVLGAEKKQLRFQFLSEAIVMTLFAFVFSLLAAIFLKGWYHELTDVQLHLGWKQISFWASIAGSILLVGLIAGSYPAFFLSAFRPLEIMQENRSGKKSRNSILRNTLVIFQFSVATSLIVGSFFIYRQLTFISQKKLGFDKDQVLVLDDTYTLRNNIESFKQKILQYPNVRSATVTSYLPIPSSRSNSTFSKGRELREDLAINMDNWPIDYDYADTYQLKLKEGRFFDKAFSTDSNAVVLNEAAIKILGFENPVGEKIFGMENVSGKPTPEDFVEYTVIGVLEDFHFEGLQEEISALGLFLGRSTGSISIAFSGSEVDHLIADLRNLWQVAAPNQPFAYRFADEAFARQYTAEKRIGRITLIFAVMAIFVSCLGLFGLSTFVMEQRKKEIGIRKVLGATTSNLVTMLSRQFIGLVLVGILIALPITWYFVSGWMENFAYRIPVHWSTFLIASGISILIAFLTVGGQSLKAALANPIISIKSE